MSEITVLLADDHTIVREGLRLLIDTTRDIKVVGEAQDGREAVRLVEELQPAVVVMDLVMPQLNGVEAARQILRARPATKVLVLSSYKDEEKLAALIAYGISGYLVKHTASADLLRAIREASEGRSFFSDCISKNMLERCRATSMVGKPKRGGALHLTSREAEVLQLIAEGHSNKEIGAILNLSFKTVEKHRQLLMDKLNIHETAGLTRYAMACGAVERPVHLECSRLGQLTQGRPARMKSDAPN